MTTPQERSARSARGSDDGPGRARRYGPFAAALLLDLAGSVIALLVALRTWQTITTPRPAPLHNDVLGVPGRAIDGGPFALALVALAGVVALLATRGMWRRVVGAVLALAGLTLVWRAVISAPAVGASRARALVAARHPAVDAGSAVPHVVTHPVWVVLTVVGGLFVLAAGAWTAARGHTWRAMSSRYEANAAEDSERTVQRAAAGLWSALDRGDDPTSDPTGDGDDSRR